MTNCVFDSPVQLVDALSKAGCVPLSGKTVIFSYHGVPVLCSNSESDQHSNKNYKK